MREVLLKIAERVSVDDIMVYVVILALVFMNYVMLSIIRKLVNDIGDIGSVINDLSENSARHTELMRMLVVGRIKGDVDEE